jgi:hypothetical protein
LPLDHAVFLLKNKTYFPIRLVQISKKVAIYLTIGNARQLIMRQYIESLNNLARVGNVNEKNPRNLITVLLTTL